MFSFGAQIRCFLPAGKISDGLRFDANGDLRFNGLVDSAQLLDEVKALNSRERTQFVEEAIRHLTPEERKPIERLLRRLQHPEIPESFWQGVEDHEEGRSVEMETVDITHAIYTP